MQKVPTKREVWMHVTGWAAIVFVIFFLRLFFVEGAGGLGGGGFFCLFGKTETRGIVEGLELFRKFGAGQEAS